MISCLTSLAHLMRSIAPREVESDENNRLCEGKDAVPSIWNVAFLSVAAKEVMSCLMCRLCVHAVLFHLSSSPVLHRIPEYRKKMTADSPHS